MKKFSTLDVAAIVLWLIPAAYLLYVYPTLPDNVPVHFGITGEPDRYGSKEEFLIGPLILLGMTILVYLLLKFLPAIDPKKYVKYGEPTFQKIGLAAVMLLSVVTIGIIIATANHSFKASKFIFPAIGIFFAFLGNMMHSLKPNYFAGVRTPWTLEDPENWRITHRLAGKLWFVGGIVLTMAVLLLPDKTGFIVFMIMIALLSLIPVIYSFIYFKKHQSK